MTISLVLGCVWAGIFGAASLSSIRRRGTLDRWSSPIALFTGLLAVSSVAVVPILLLRDTFPYWAEAYLLANVAWYGAMHALALALRRRLLLPDSTCVTTSAYILGNVAVIGSFVAAHANINWGGGENFGAANLSTSARIFWACVATFGVAQLIVMQRYLTLLRSDSGRGDLRRLKGYQFANGLGIVVLSYGAVVSISGNMGSPTYHVLLATILALSLIAYLVLAFPARKEPRGRHRLFCKAPVTPARQT